MIKHVESVDKTFLLQIANEHLGINYFILLGLSISKMIYKEIYYFHNSHTNALEAVLLKRNSGNLQLMCRCEKCSQEVCRDFQSLIQELDFRELIASYNTMAAIAAEILFTTHKPGALISLAHNIRLSTENLPVGGQLRPLKAGDVNLIEALYKEVFQSFTPAEVIRKKLEMGRGRGLGLFLNNTLIAVAQTDFETMDKAIIVGVATHPSHQHQGYGHLIMSALCQPLIDEGKELILHYNNDIAGKLYKKMGFKQTDQIGHYSKTDLLSKSI